MMKNLYRGEVFYLIASPLDHVEAYRYFEDGGLAVVDGKIVEAGPFEAMRSLRDTAHVDGWDQQKDKDDDQIFHYQFPYIRLRESVLASQIAQMGIRSSSNFQ